MLKPNYWVWTAKTQELKFDRIAGTSVPLGYLIEGFSEYFPRSSWIKKGYVEKTFQGVSEIGNR
jgi:hypothetical protein